MGQTLSLFVVAMLLLPVLVEAGVMLRVTNSKGDVFVVETDDPSLELTTQKNGAIVSIRDTKAGKTWALDTEKQQLGFADAPDGLGVKLEARGTLTLQR